MTEIMPVPRNLILLSYQQGALFGCFLFIGSEFSEHNMCAVPVLRYCKAR